MNVFAYHPSAAPEWNDFVARSRQRSFLFKRDYMDYHSDRFEDCSLMVRNDAGRCVALLPANRVGEVVWSHRGLTYGGWITPVKGFDASTMLAVWDAAMEFYRSRGVRELVYKPLPWIYHVCPADDDLYALFRAGAGQIACGVSTAIDLRNPVGFDENSRRNMNRARREGLSVVESDDFPRFWKILTEVLESRHGVRPVHSVDEIQLLASRFPENIRLYVVEDACGEMLAGVVAYISASVVHLQYIASSGRGRSVGALALLVNSLVAEFASLPGLRYLDFGISTENGGTVLNEGLNRQKSGFGGRTVAYQQFSVLL